MYLSPRKKLFVDTATSKFGVGAILNRQEVQSAADDANIPFPWWFWKTAKVGYNQFQLPSVGGPETVTATMTSSTPVASSDAQVNLQPAPKVSLSVETTAFTENLVPAVDPLFVPFGNFTKIKQIISSKMFYPVYVTGLSGNGKTFGIEQACAQARREVIRINFTVETDEDDLIGGFRLIDGDTKFFKGPIINAMEKGAVALLDELDLANPAKVMCLQSILEGKGYFIKKTGEFIKPAPGFTVIATANTKGKGSEDGRFIGTNILNEAFLERFAITVEQPYPTAATEKKIVMGSMKKYGEVDEEFATNLVTWAEVIRKTFYDGGVDEIISTRRLDHIVKAFTIFKDKMTAIEMCVARFDEDTKESFIDLYTKVDAGVMTSEDTEEKVEEGVENEF